MLTLGVVLAAAGVVASPVGASGESTTVTLVSPTSGTSATFVWTYVFNQNGGHGLSNIAIRLCNDDLLSHVVAATPGGEIFTSGDVPGGHPGFGPGIKFPLTAATGGFSVVFDQPYPPGGAIEVQSHSGDGQEGDLITVGGGPGPACPNSTTTTAPPQTTTTAPPEVTTTTAPPEVTTTTAPPQTTTTAPPEVTTTTAPPEVTTTTAPPEVTTTTRVPPPQVTTTIPPVTTTIPPVTTTVPTLAVQLTPSTTIPTEVLGVTYLNDPGQLARTGSSSIGPLVVLGFVLAMIGLGLLVGEWADPRRMAS